MTVICKALLLYELKSLIIIKTAADIRGCSFLLLVFCVYVKIGVGECQKYITRITETTESYLSRHCVVVARGRIYLVNSRSNENTVYEKLNLNGNIINNSVRTGGACRIITRSAIGIGVSGIYVTNLDTDIEFFTNSKCWRRKYTKT